MLCLIAFATALSTIPASAAVDEAITGIVTDAGTLWTSVKGFVIGVVAFVLMLGLVKLIRKK